MCKSRHTDILKYTEVMNDSMTVWMKETTESEITILMFNFIPLFLATETIATSSPSFSKNLIQHIYIACAQKTRQVG